MIFIGLLFFFIFIFLLYLIVRGLVRWLVRNDPNLRCNKCQNYCDITKKD